ncbi:MAG: efflux transporter outer membrane subunit [Candidatus Korobacteraceae bacterium]
MREGERSRHCGPVVLILASAMLVLFTAGCAVKRPPDTTQAVKDSLPAATKIPDQWTSQGASAAAVQTEWLKSFGDPQMDAIVAEGLKNNLYLQAAATRIDAAANIVTEAHSQMLPMVGVLGSGAYLGRYNQKNVRGQDKGRYNASSLLGSVSWELDLWGRIRAQTAAAQQELAATQADVQFARESLAAMTAKTWYLAVYTRILQSYARQNVQLKQRNLELTQAKFQVGEVQDQQIAMANADLAAAQSQLTQANSAYEQVIRALEILLGRYPSAELQVAEMMVALPPAVPAGLPSQLLERRPDVIAAERTFDAAFHMVQSTKAARLPAISLTGAGGYMTNEIYQKLALRPWIWTVGANLAAPLYTGGFLQAQVKIANDNQKAALALYGQTALQAFGEVEVTLSNERFLREEKQDADTVLKNAEQALGVEQTKYRVGQVDLDPVLQLQAAELGAKIAVAEVQYELLANRINLHLALGGGF